MSEVPLESPLLGPAPDGAPAPRLLTIMGSGETAPTMVKVHRAMLERLGPPPVPAVLLDTPFAFQENAAELCERIRRYFSESLQAKIDVAGPPATAAGSESGDGSWSAAPEDPFAEERLLSALRRARYVFAGPGSPTYALRKWTSTVVPSVLGEMLTHGGGVTFSSAAALTLGASVVPVYEIYKAGADPYWVDGLDLTATLGLHAAVIPHYNNAEGGTHDTRFCYLGERRLAYLESRLEAGTFVLGVDEHTAVTFDLVERFGTVAGLGVVTVRASGRSRTFSAGSVIGIDEILEIAEDLAHDVAHSSISAQDKSATVLDGASATSRGDRSANDTQLASAPEAPPAPAYTDSPLIALVRERESEFADALARRDIDGAVGQVLELEAQITDWSTDIPFGDALERARASLRSLVVELGRVSHSGLRDPRDIIGPFVEVMLEIRKQARAAGRFEEADRIRDQLASLGVEIRDGAEATTWLLQS
ncbi:MAG: CysS/YqeB C-terminal domain-containing protein [Acidimicrobiales bacterium]